jgi:hypothetical protein
MVPLKLPAPSLRRQRAKAKAKAKAKDYTREQWEAALDKAERRAEPDENELPLIVVDDFF